MTEINRDDVADYYIECELDNIVAADDIQLRKDLYHSNTVRLLEALSFTYRANSVFDYVYGGRFRWEKRCVSIDDILLTGMGKQLTPLIYSDEIRQNPRKFVEYVERHPDDARFDELRPSNVPEDRQIVLLRQEKDGLRLLDGSHRFLSMVMQGVPTVDAYIAIPVGDSVKPMIGDAIFLRLRKLWQQTDDSEFRKSIEQTVVGMIKASSDGLQAVKSYWVAMAPNDEVKAAGERLVASAPPER